MASTASLPPVGDLLSRSFGQLGRAWFPITALAIVGTLLTGLAVLLVYLLAFAIITVVQGRELFDRIQANPQAVQYLFEDPATGMLLTLLSIVAMLVAVRVWSTFALATVHVAAEPTVGFRDALRLARPRSLALIGLCIVMGLAINLATLALILPGIWLAVRLHFVVMVFARAPAGVMEAMRQGFALTAGRFWAILGRVLLLGLVGGLIMIVPIVGWVIGTCVQLVGWGLIYKDLGGPDTVQVPR